MTVKNTLVQAMRGDKRAMKVISDKTLSCVGVLGVASVAAFMAFLPENIHTDPRVSNLVMGEVRSAHSEYVISASKAFSNLPPETMALLEQVKGFTSLETGMRYGFASLAAQVDIARGKITADDIGKMAQAILDIEPRMLAAKSEMMAEYNARGVDVKEAEELVSLSIVIGALIEDGETPELTSTFQEGVSKIKADLEVGVSKSYTTINLPSGMNVDDPFDAGILAFSHIDKVRSIVANLEEETGLKRGLTAGSSSDDPMKRIVDHNDGFWYRAHKESNKLKTPIRGKVPMEIFDVGDEPGKLFSYEQTSLPSL